MELAPLMSDKCWHLRIKLQQSLSAPSLSETFTGSAIFSLHGPSLVFSIDKCFGLMIIQIQTYYANGGLKLKTIEGINIISLLRVVVYKM